jgi:hypothetical protein
MKVGWKMAYDSMALAVDWLDAYRGKSPDVADMYQTDAVLSCACHSAITIAGRAALESYWRDRFEQRPALELVDLIRRSEDVVSVKYQTPVGVVEAVLGFDKQTHKIAWQRCGRDG